MRRGGNSKISGLVLNELESIHTTGSAAKHAPRTSATTRAAFWPVFFGGVRSAGASDVRVGVASVVISVPRLLVPHVEEREDHRHEEHEHRGRGRDGEL